MKPGLKKNIYMKKAIIGWSKKTMKRKYLNGIPKMASSRTFKTGSIFWLAIYPDPSALTLGTHPSVFSAKRLNQLGIKTFLLCCCYVMKRGIKHLFNGSVIAFYQYNYRTFQIYSTLECWLAPFYQSGMLIFVWPTLNVDYNNKFNIKLNII